MVCGTNQLWPLEKHLVSWWPQNTCKEVSKSHDTEESLICYHLWCSINKTCPQQADCIHNLDRCHQRSIWKPPSRLPRPLYRLVSTHHISQHTGQTYWDLKMCSPACLVSFHRLTQGLLSLVMIVLMFLLFTDCFVVCLVWSPSSLPGKSFKGHHVDRNCQFISLRHWGSGNLTSMEPIKVLWWCLIQCPVWLM